MSKKLLMNTNANTQDNYKRYYQEYEGTFITATDKSEDDTIDTSRFIEVTEIWGNTVQDEENLEDIQSIGELYVNEDGEPILDDLGREQYRVDIISYNGGNIINNYMWQRGTINSSNGNLNTADWVKFAYMDYIDIEQYNMKNAYLGSSIDKNWFNMSIFEYDANFNFIKCTNKRYFEVEIEQFDDNTKYIRLSIEIDFVTNGIDMYSPIFSMKNNIKKYEIPYESNKTTILLPCQLQKVGDVYDRLYWDSEKGKYVVEKKIFEINGFSKIEEHGIQVEGFYTILINNTDIKISGKNINSLGLTNEVYANLVNKLYEFICQGSNYVTGSAGFVVRVLNSKASNLDEAKQLLTDFSCIFEVNTPQLIETNITEKIQLPCYSEKTHIFVNSTVDASMKVLVPYKEII